MRATTLASSNFTTLLRVVLGRTAALSTWPTVNECFIPNLFFNRFMFMNCWETSLLASPEELTEKCRSPSLSLGVRGATLLLQDTLRLCGPSLLFPTDGRGRCL